MSIPPKGVPAGDHDADPTGIRDLLADLSDPGPMPEHLVARISASLDQEQQRRRSSEGWATHAPEHTGARPISHLAEERERRGPQQWILAAAAVLAVGVTGTVVYDQILSPDSGPGVLAQLTPGDQDEADSGSQNADSVEAEPAEDAGGEAESRADGVDDQAADAAAEKEEAAQGGVEGIDDAAFALGAASLLQVAAGTAGSDGDAFAQAPLGFQTQPGDVQALSADELDPCVRVVGGNPQQGEWAGTPADVGGDEVVIVGDLAPGQSRAWAVSENCSDDPGADVLTGPVPIP